MSDPFGDIDTVGSQPPVLVPGATTPTTSDPTAAAEFATESVVSAPSIDDSSNSEANVGTSEFTKSSTPAAIGKDSHDELVSLISTATEEDHSGHDVNDISAAAGGDHPSHDVDNIGSKQTEKVVDGSSPQISVEPDQLFLGDAVPQQDASKDAPTSEPFEVLGNGNRDEAEAVETVGSQNTAVEPEENHGFEIDEDVKEVVEDNSQQEAPTAAEPNYEMEPELLTSDNHESETDDSQPDVPSSQITEPETSMRSGFVPAPQNDGPVKMPKTTTVSMPRSGSSDKTLSAWLKKVDPKVNDLLLWRDPRLTGAVLSALLILLACLARYSIFTVISYTLLAALTASLVARLVRFVMAKVHTGDSSHPFGDILEAESLLSEASASDLSHMVVQHFNPFEKAVRELVFVKDIFPSLKFGCVLVAFTYIGAWFNGLTVVTLAAVAAFTLPKVYEVNKVQVDRYVDVALTKIDDVYQMLQEKLPLVGKQKRQ